MKKDIDLKTISTIVITILIAFLAVYLMFSMSKYNERTNERQTREIVRVIQKAAIQCYALEGSYPPDMEYIADNYGVILDEVRYIYHYEVYGSNIMPDIQVFQR